MALFKIGSTDVPTESVEKDLFHIKTYIDGLSTFIKECATPMTISIQGDWGSGKTSMMNMIKEQVSSTVHYIWFNTWQFSQFDMGNSLVFSMMEVVLGELGYNKKAIATILQGVLGIAKRYAMGVIEETTHGAIPADSADGNNNSNYANEIFELKKKFQNAINEKITKDKKDRVVVFVDDLDRLQPEKAVELLEVLKLFIDCENCVFVIAVDYDVVTRGIRQKYGLDVNEEKGKSFFDKIIQLPFKVPVAQYDIKEYVSQSLSGMNISVAASDIELFVQLIQNSIGLNPRSMKRLFNTYQLLDIITKASVKGLEEKYRHKILFSIICMQMGHEKLYQFFASNPIDAELLEPLNEETSRNEWINEVLADENIADADSRYISKANKFLLYFYKSIQNDDDDKISESELVSLQSVLKCSSVVSLNNDNESVDNKMESDNRKKNKDLAERIKCTLSDLGKFDLWLPKYANKEKDIKFSDVSCSLSFVEKTGIKFTLEYYISTFDDNAITAYIILRSNTKSDAAKFLHIMGQNPLNFDTLPEIAITDKGRIMYSKKILLSEAVEGVSELYRKAHAEIQKFL